MGLARIGEYILFLPVIVSVAIIGVGLILYVVTHLVTFIFHIFAAIFNLPFSQVEIPKPEPKIPKTKAEEREEAQDRWEELLRSAKQGRWLVWLAAIPAVLIILSLLFSLLTFF